MAGTAGRSAPGGLVARRRPLVEVVRLDRDGQARNGLRGLETVCAAVGVSLRLSPPLYSVIRMTTTSGDQVRFCCRMHAAGSRHGLLYRPAAGLKGQLAAILTAATRGVCSERGAV